MRISVIIPTLEAGKQILRCFSRLENQTIQADEIIVIDSSSTDDTAEIARHAGYLVEIIPKLEFNHGGTRNLGVQLARGDVLVFMTQDALPMDSYFLEELTKPIREGVAVAAYARQVPYSDATPLGAFTGTFNYPEKSHIKTIEDVRRMRIKAFFFSNVASAISRKAISAVGGFPDWVIMNEDMLLSAKLLRAGCAVAYQAEARVYHSHNYTVKEVFKRYFDIGTFTFQARDFLEGADTRGEGVRFVLGQLKYLLHQGELMWIPRCLIECAVKYVAYQMGKHSQIIPKRLKRRLSMHSFFWGETVNEESGNT